MIIINVLKDTRFNTIVPANIMPIMERDFDDAVIRITRNVLNYNKHSKTKPGFDFLVSSGASGMNRYGLWPWSL